jgi:DNA-binding GntR family transcriptional regulator
MSDRRLKRPPLGQEAARLLGEMIIRGELEPGERLVEEKLADRLGVSRTPLREAFQRLESKGLVQKRPRGGYVVRPLTADEVEEAVDIRTCLESYAARLAARRRNEEALSRMGEAVTAFEDALGEQDEAALMEINSAFHEALLDAADSRLLRHVMSELEAIVERTSRLLIHNLPAGKWSAPDHRAIYKAISTGDEEHAEKIVTEHVRRGGEWLVERMRETDLQF